MKFILQTIVIVILLIPVSVLADDSIIISSQDEHLDDLVIELPQGSSENIEIDIKNVSDIEKKVHLYIDGDDSLSLTSDTRFFQQINDDDIHQQLLDNNYNILLFCSKQQEKKSVINWCEGQKDLNLDISPGESARLYIVININDDAPDHEANLIITENDDIIQSITLKYVIPNKNVSAINLIEFSVQKINKLFELNEWFNNGLRDKYKANVSVESVGAKTTEYEYCTIVESVWTNEIVDFCNNAIIKYGEQQQQAQEITMPRFGKVKIKEIISYIDENNKEIKKESQFIDVVIIPIQLIIVTISIGLSCVLIYNFIIKNMFGKKKNKKSNFLGTYVVKDVDNIISIAQLYDIPWKELAKVNEIEPPYILIAGETINVPSKIDEEADETMVNKGRQVVAATGVEKKQIQSNEQQNATQQVKSMDTSVRGGVDMKKTTVQSQNMTKNNNVQQVPQSATVNQNTVVEKKISYASPKNMVTKPSVEPTTNAIDIEWMKDDENLYSEEMQVQEKKANLKFTLLVIVIVAIVAALTWWGVTWFLNQNEEKNTSVDNLIEQQETVEENAIVLESENNIEQKESVIEENSVVEEDTEEEVADIDKGAITVQVLNAGAAVGAAGTITEEFSTEGYKVNDATNAKNTYENVIIYYNSENKEALDDISAVVSEKYGTQESEESKSITEKYNSDFVVVLGA